MGIVYAIARNGMWDDPAVANTGSIARSFDSNVKSDIFGSGRIGPYLTWRCSYMICGIFFCAVRLALGISTLRDGGSKYVAFLEQQLPPQLPMQRFQTLAQVLSYEDVAVWALAFISWCILIVSVFMALPSRAVNQAKTSRKLIWLSWSVTMVPLFVLFVVFPIRSVVDWEGVIADTCAFSVKKTLDAPGSNLKETIPLLEEQGLLDAGIQGISDTESWCKKKGADWHSAFYNDTVRCIWELDDNCRDQFCKQSSQPELVECLTNCIPFTLKQQPQRKALFHEKLKSCTQENRPFSLGAPPVASFKTDVNDPPKLYDLMVYSQRRAIVGGAEAVSMASMQAEYVVGLLIGIVAGKYLISASLSLLGGLAEAAMNVKAMFPGSQQPGWILILTTAEALPLYVAIMAVFQQLLGDGIMCIACIMASLFASSGIVTGLRILAIKSGDAEREKLYKRAWFEYFLRGLTGFGAVAALVVWATRQGLGVQQYVRHELLSIDVIITSVADYYSKKILSAIAGTDAVLTGFVQSERWHQQMTEESKRDHSMAVQDLDLLVSPKQFNKTDVDGKA